ncbi:hypothetical protein MJO28_012235 [Puccinia striiformis f. sp. tritici]|uniref:Uncharacterized protein n=1 Tax=Puccinia striiformis f. sp. tritici TaxID=168172 RepID=A0ACC0E196_9BASI|nr:hypothetical protein MJO28_012235 [Puccinia striiformis f. sp. tritici]
MDDPKVQDLISSNNAERRSTDQEIAYVGLDGLYSIKISDVIRVTIESDDPIVTIANIEKYFTEDAYLHFSIFKQPQAARSRRYLQGIYKILLMMSETFSFVDVKTKKNSRLATTNNKIDIHSVMFSQDGLLGAIESTSTGFKWTDGLKILGQLRFWLLKPVFSFRCIIRLDLRKNRKGKYRIRRQRYEISTESDSSRWPLPPGVGFMTNLLYCTITWMMGLLGEFLAHRGPTSLEVLSAQVWIFHDLEFRVLRSEN